MAIMHSDEDRTIPGNALALQAKPRLPMEPLLNPLSRCFRRAFTRFDTPFSLHLNAIGMPCSLPPQADKPFRSLAMFGTAFLSKFEVRSLCVSVGLPLPPANAISTPYCPPPGGVLHVKHSRAHHFHRHSRRAFWGKTTHRPTIRLSSCLRVVCGACGSNSLAL